MMCEILDFRCIFVSELIGNVLLTVVLGAIFYFIIASRLRFGFDTTIFLGIPILLILGIAFGGFSTIFVFSTVIVGFLLSWIFNQIVPNR